MYSEPHPESSGHAADTRILHCDRCGWHTAPLDRDSWARANYCGNCGCHGLRYINYHAATETVLAQRVLTEAVARARQTG